MTDLIHGASVIAPQPHPLALPSLKDAVQPPGPAVSSHPPPGLLPPSSEEAVTADNDVAASCSHHPLSYCPNCLNCQDCGYGCTCAPPDYPEEDFIA